jgi:hypothetical protein
MHTPAASASITPSARASLSGPRVQPNSNERKYPMITFLWIWLLAAPILLAGLSLVGTNR